ncbi:hypothetical protein GCM10028774_15560 [Spirosoma jeollabukense]
MALLPDHRIVAQLRVRTVEQVVRVGLLRGHRTAVRQPAPIVVQILLRIAAQAVPVVLPDLRITAKPA